MTVALHSQQQGKYQNHFHKSMEPWTRTSRYCDQCEPANGPGKRHIPCATWSTFLQLDVMYVGSKGFILCRRHPEQECVASYFEKLLVYRRSKLQNLQIRVIGFNNSALAHALRKTNFPNLLRLAVIPKDKFFWTYHEENTTAPWRTNKLTELTRGRRSRSSSRNHLTCVTLKSLMLHLCNHSPLQVLANLQPFVTNLILLIDCVKFCPLKWEMPILIHI